MNRILVAGIGTDVGKTVVSAILATLFHGDYWKPIQCGEEETSDSVIMSKLLDATKHHIYPSTYSFKAPLSPHHAAKIAGTPICVHKIIPPISERTLVIEGVGGIFVPLDVKTLTIDLFKPWKCRWVLVSQHYLGSINHTLLTLDALKRQQITVIGIIFNGLPNHESEEVILNISKIPFLGRLLPEPLLNKQMIQRYTNQWQNNFSKLLP